MVRATVLAAKMAELRSCPMTGPVTVSTQRASDLKEQEDMNPSSRGN